MNSLSGEESSTLSELKRDSGNALKAESKSLCTPFEVSVVSNGSIGSEEVKEKDSGPEAKRG